MSWRAKCEVDAQRRENENIAQDGEQNDREQAAGNENGEIERPDGRNVRKEKEHGEVVIGRGVEFGHVRVQWHVSDNASMRATTKRAERRGARDRRRERSESKSNNLIR